MALKLKATIPSSDEIGGAVHESYGIISMLRICNELLSRGPLTRETAGDMAEVLYRAMQSEMKIRVFLEELESQQFVAEQKTKQAA